MNTTDEKQIITTSEHMAFSAQTRMSGLNLKDGTKIRKGAYDTIKQESIAAGHPIPRNLEQLVHQVSSVGGHHLLCR